MCISASKCGFKLPNARGERQKPPFHFARSWPCHFACPFMTGFNPRVTERTMYVTLKAGLTGVKWSRASPSRLRVYLIVFVAFITKDLAPAYIINEVGLVDSPTVTTNQAD